MVVFGTRAVLCCMNEEGLLTEDALHKLPALDSASCTNVIREEVFCTKIIHQKATHQSRFTWTATYRKIMEYSYPDMTLPQTCPTSFTAFPRPVRSPFPCFQCHLRFDWPPVFLPITTLGGLRTEWGNFCDPTCINTYLHRNMNDSNLAARAADLFEYCQDVHGLDAAVDIGFAPHFSEIDTYGGALSEAAFRKIARTPGLRTFERMAPFIPTPAVVEWQCQVSEADIVSAAETAATAVHSAKQQRHAALMAAASGMAAPTRSVAAQERDTLLAAAAAQTGLARHLRTTSGADLSSLAPTSASCGGNGTDATAPASAATAILDAVLGTRSDTTASRHQWEVTGLRQPTQEQIEQRLMSLPRVEKKTGLYDLYWARHTAAADEAAAFSNRVEDAATLAVTAPETSGTSTTSEAGKITKAVTASLTKRSHSTKKRTTSKRTVTARAMESTAAAQPSTTFETPASGIGASLIAAKRARVS